MSEADLEVKTTTGERREHWISTTTQLVPTGDRPLYLLSIQLTAAALDAGHTLPSLIASARSTLATHVRPTRRRTGAAGVSGSRFGSVPLTMDSPDLAGVLPGGTTVPGCDPGASRSHGAVSGADHGSALSR